MVLTDERSLSRLKLSSKRLKSGKVQVKFQVNTSESGRRYGYMLTEPKDSLKDVVTKIIDNYNCVLSIGSQRHLFSIGRQKQATGMLMFK